MADKTCGVTMLFRVLGLAATFAAIAILGKNLTLELELEKDKQEAEKQAQVKSAKRTETARKSNNPTRAPAARSSAIPERGTLVRTSERDEQTFRPPQEDPPAGGGEAASSGPMALNSASPYEGGRSGRGQGGGHTAPSSSGRGPVANSNKSSSGSKFTSPNSMMSAGPMSFFGAPLVPKNVTKKGENNKDSGSSSGSSSGTSESVTICAADIGSGSFATPISVSLSCSTAATIKYCLSENTCCDPYSGSAYTGPIVIGEQVTSYCLSFVGTTASGKSSTTTQKSYSFNADLPDLQVSHKVQYYQTTQMRGLLQMTSDNFGGENLAAGVINLRTHDPAALGMTCADIVNDHAQLSSPSSALVLNDQDVSSLSSTDQLDVYFTLPQLQYGNNYLSTYLKNTLFADLVACSTTNVVLEDFPYFDAQIAHGEVGNNDVREFSGGFTAVGFFEPEATVYRGPAGTSTQNVSQQELRSGAFGIFY